MCVSMCVYVSFSFFVLKGPYGRCPPPEILLPWGRWKPTKSKKETCITLLLIQLYTYRIAQQSCEPPTAPLKKSQSSRVSGPNCTHAGSEKEAWRCTPSTYLRPFRGFWGAVVHTLGGCWAPLCMALGRSGRALERLLGGLQRGVGASWRGLGCHFGAQDGSEFQKISNKVWLQ